MHQLVNRSSTKEGGRESANGSENELKEEPVSVLINHMMLESVENKKMVSVNKTNNVSELPILPGQKLKQIRDKRGLSLEQVAEQLHLPIRYIKAIELDDYDRLPGVSYTRGYMKNYCRLLDIPSNEIIALFNDLVVEESQDANITSISTPSIAQRALKMWRMLNLQWHAYAVVTVVLLLVAISFWPDSGSVSDTLMSELEAIQFLDNQLPEEPQALIQPQKSGQEDNLLRGDAISMGEKRVAAMNDSTLSYERRSSIPMMP